MCYITASGYNRMQQITDALNGMTPEMQDLASLNCVEEAVKILKNRGAKNEADCADNDGKCLNSDSKKEVRWLNRMKELREAKGLSKSAVAEAVGITVSAILKYEAGITQPSVYAAWKLAKLYGVTIEEMMGYDGRRGD